MLRNKETPGQRDQHSPRAGATPGRAEHTAIFTQFRSFSSGGLFTTIEGLTGAPGMYSRLLRPREPHYYNCIKF